MLKARQVLYGNDRAIMAQRLPLEDNKHQPSCRSQRGLDWFAFFLADIQTGWGPFVAAYLTSRSWTQLDIGLILTVGTLAAMALQIPIGALIDHVPAKRLLAAVAVAAISGSALLLAVVADLRAWCLPQRCCTRSRAVSLDRFSPRSASGS